MKRQRRRTAVAVSIDPDLERRWEAALLTRPANSETAALVAWNERHNELLTAYQAAVEEAQRQRDVTRRARARRRRRIATAVIALLLCIGAIVYWVTRPSEDELRSEAAHQADVACNAHYGQTRHLTVVSKQIDLLQDGEGGWLELRPYSQPVPVGGVDLSPAELLAGKTGKAQVNREAYVQDSSRYIGPWALAERQKGQLIVTLFSLEGFGELPHAPLRVASASAATVRGEKVSPSCF